METPADVDGTRRPEGDGGDEERALVAGLRRRDEAAFVALLGRYQRMLIRIALTYVPNRAVAEDVVQETWVGVLNGIDRFERRSSLKTWIVAILANQARRRGAREHRTVAFSDLGATDHDATEPAVDPARFLPEGERWAGHWAVPPRPWDPPPDERVLSAELRLRIEEAIAALPPEQRRVITLRDVEGWSAAEVCAALRLTAGNQRVLLHRARSRVRRALEACYAGEESLP